jgi:hypothetical protein
MLNSSLPLTSPREIKALAGMILPLGYARLPLRLLELFSMRFSPAPNGKLTMNKVISSPTSAN